MTQAQRASGIPALYMLLLLVAWCGMASSAPVDDSVGWTDQFIGTVHAWHLSIFHNVGCAC